MTTQPASIAAAGRHRVPTTCAAVVAALFVAMLTECTAEASKNNGPPADRTNQVYQSGDGTTQTWPVANRGDAVIHEHGP